MNGSEHSRPHRSVVLVAVATAISLLGDQALYAILPTYYGKLGLGMIEVGVLLSVNRWVRLLTNHLAETLARRWSPLGVLVAALALGAVLTMAYGVLPFFIAMLAARVLWGLCWSCIRQVGIMAAVDTALAEHSARVMGHYDGISRVGSIAGMVGGALLFNGIDFRWVFLILGVLSLAAVVPGAAAVRGLHGHPSVFYGGEGPRKSNSLLLLACAVILGCATTGVTSALGYYLTAQLGESFAIGGMTVKTGTLNGLMLGTQYALNFLMAHRLGTLQDRIGHRQGSAVFFAAGMAVVGAAALWPSLGVVLPLFVAFYLCAIALGVVLTAEAGRQGSKAFASYASAGDLGAAIGPLLIWSLLKLVPYPATAFAAGAVLFAAGAVVALVRLGRQRSST